MGPTCPGYSRLSVIWDTQPTKVVRPDAQCRGAVPDGGVIWGGTLRHSGAPSRSARGHRCLARCGALTNSHVKGQAEACPTSPHHLPLGVPASGPGRPALGELPERGEVFALGTAHRGNHDRSGERAEPAGRAAFAQRHPTSRLWTCRLCGERVRVPPLVIEPPPARMPLAVPNGSPK